ncbi:CpsD/CapB family tyrosine-protein kinase [Robertmurraya korlensis]|uniref:CpsD/CapB family tyrosine-protein kinase n=1 Tax=Robertmurraya korlensis TaxID=519977 RepID=UPI00352819D0
MRLLGRKKRVKKRRNIQLISFSNSISPINEQYRLIRNNIHFSSVDNELSSILITSAEPSEGKSTTAANLAIVLAQKGKRVILVDADLRKPTIHYAFSLSNKEGLTTVLTKDCTLETAIMRTEVAYLDVLTSGPIPPNPSELLDSKSMEIVMKELKGLYDYIVYDTPPILAVADSQNIANKCDGVVMVISSGETRRDRAIKAKELIEKAGSKMLGVVINGVEKKKDDFYGLYS